LVEEPEGFSSLETVALSHEWRSDPYGRTVLIALARGDKPVAAADAGRGDISCIFCPEERSTLAEPYIKDKLVLEEMFGRKLYIVENKYPTVATPESMQGVDLRFVPKFGGIAITSEPAIGRHLVMIETPNHDLDPFSANEETRRYYTNIVWGYKEMLNALKNEGLVWGGIGKNRNGLHEDGTVLEAGSSQPHPHSQAIAITRIPSHIYEALRIWTTGRSDFDSRMLAEEYLSGCGGCMEARDGMFGATRLLMDEHNVSYMDPMGGDRTPYDIRIKILPLAHQSHFETMTEERTNSFAEILHNTMVTLGQMWPGMGYNFGLSQGPWISEGDDLRIPHWEFSIYPAWPDLNTLKQTGVISHILGATVHKRDPVDIADEIRKYRP